MINNYVGGGYKARNGGCIKLGYHAVEKSEFLRTIQIIEAHTCFPHEREIFGFENLEQYYDKEQKKYLTDVEKITAGIMPRLVNLYYKFPVRINDNYHKDSVIKISFSESLDLVTTHFENGEIMKNENTPKNRPGYLIINSSEMEAIIKAVLAERLYFRLNEDNIFNTLTDSFICELAGGDPNGFGLSLKEMAEDYPNRMPTLEDLVNSFARVSAIMDTVGTKILEGVEPPSQAIH